MVMPFGLENARATYQSKKTEAHFEHLRKVFERCQKYDMKMNPLKCTFGVTKGKFLGFLINKGSIKIDEDKTKAMLAMTPLSE